MTRNCAKSEKNRYDFSAFQSDALTNRISKCCFSAEGQRLKQAGNCGESNRFTEAGRSGRKKDAYPSELSGGQKQRVAIARALANDPKVLLCDEATSALDPQTTRSILRLLKEVNQRLGITIVLITHEMAVIKEICNRVAVMEDGEVVEEGNIIDIFAHPKAQVTKNFISTTSSLSKIYEMVENNSPITQISKGQWLVHLKYGAGNTKEALLSHMTREMQVDTSIIYGNVEVIHDTPLGDLVVILGGKESDIKMRLPMRRQTVWKLR